MPVSVYRLQLTPHFGFAAVIKIADYLADLGITHVYLSPILQAVPTSEHGYDVTDHSRIRAEFGGEEGFREMARALRERRIGIVLDIVPNHMAVPVPEFQNRPLWSVLHGGPESEYAHWFDIDWTGHEGRMLLPILPARPEECLDDMAVDPDGPDGLPVLRYFDHMLPLWPGTARLPMAGLLESQHYKLADWRVAATSLNWRRFFDITSLIGVRVEDPGVFDATHEVVLRLVDEGLIDGLRVDHPDGLADPRGYFRRLADATGGMWVVAEKILAWGERLPADWPVAGTTGYDALRVAGGLFMDPAGAAPLAAEYAGFVEKAGLPSPPARFADVAAVAKQEVTAMAFGSEVSRLGGALRRTSALAAPDDLHQVLTELLAAFDVYRAYTYPGEEPSRAAIEAIHRALDAARGRLPARLHPVAVAVAAAALTGEGEFAVRFQQTTGPVLAKGIEDTAAYRWPRLVSLNEVGGDPDRFGVTPAEFHGEAARLQDAWPGTMTTLSTHDTKRQEDVRARLAVLAEIPGAWSDKVAEWHAQARAPRGPGSGSDELAIDPETEYFLWQTFVGSWPLSGYRLSGYLTKAVREAKRYTSWTSPNDYYEAAVHSFAAQILSDGELVTGIRAFVDEISPDAMVASLGAKLVQLTMPGVPDVYQGCELGGLSLVDPDNRRSLDFTRRWRMLAGLDSGELDLTSRDSRKLLVTSRGLRIRRDHPDWFTGDEATYTPLAAQGPAAGHVVAFARARGAFGRPGAGAAVTIATRLPVGLRRRGGWEDTVLPLPSGGGWRDRLTGQVHVDDRIRLADLTRYLPVALLERT
ncbi:MAG: malto-oligosyltrehalose synthase [Actinomycetia bacterium]|nr:malto-oligosyltrehalose synthase [Actinomycetes bacterium]